MTEPESGNNSSEARGQDVDPEPIESGIADYVKSIVGQLTALITVGGALLLLTGTIVYYFRAFFMQFPGGPTLANLPTSLVTLTGATVAVPATILSGILCFVWARRFGQTVTGTIEGAWTRAFRSIWWLLLVNVVFLPALLGVIYRLQKRPPFSEGIPKFDTWEIVGALVLVQLIFFFLVRLIVRLVAARKFTSRGKRGLVMPAVVATLVFVLGPEMALVAASIQFPKTLVCLSATKITDYAVQSTSSQVFIGVFDPKGNYVLTVPQTSVTRQSVGTESGDCPAG